MSEGSGKGVDPNPIQQILKICLHVHILKSSYLAVICNLYFPWPWFTNYILNISYRVPRSLWTKFAGKYIMYTYGQGVEISALGDLRQTSLPYCQQTSIWRKESAEQGGGRMVAGENGFLWCHEKWIAKGTCIVEVQAQW